ncbi:hypothetical protein J5O04_08200 [Corynebacterium hindlerae]|uniref:hypothetical protein n=1 Tax=Corynebacterium hindlerae TaxID=699041 RepID=UPI001AD613B3|nr:hypothetical protein [Corynebacterium hindlerae]QTH58818.1 hypothetical protein J5O04_08200 [Corynebacterium hindlerae]
MSIVVGLCANSCGKPEYLQTIGRTGFAKSPQGHPIILVQPCGGDFGKIDGLALAIMDMEDSVLDSGEYRLSHSTSALISFDLSSPAADWAPFRELAATAKKDETIYAHAFSSESEVRTVPVRVRLSEVDALDQNSVLIGSSIDSDRFPQQRISIEAFTSCN